MSSLTADFSTASTIAVDHAYRWLSKARELLTGMAALLFAALVWYGIPTLDATARAALMIFGLTLGAWVLTRLEETVVALAALLALALTGVVEPTRLFNSLGHSLIGLMIASFIVAAAANATGLSQRLASAVVRRAHSTEQLCYWLTAANLLTALFIPATSARAALMAPIFLALNQQLNNARIGKVLALVFPTAILLSAAASLTGAGAHLLTADLVAQLGGERLDFLRWLILGLPFALVSSFSSTWVILRLFLTETERQQALALPADWAETAQSVEPAASAQQPYVIGVILLMIGLWATSGLHGLDNSLVAVVGALAVVWPGLGPITLKKGLKSVEWGLLLFLAATLELGESLVRTGAAEWLISGVFSGLAIGLGDNVFLLAGGMAALGLLSHMVITSRSARAAILMPAVILLALSLGYNPAALAFSVAIASGYCLTFTVSAKPMAMFAQLPTATYGQADLLRLSTVLLPFHLVLLLVFSWWIWPLLGLSLTPA